MVTKVAILSTLAVLWIGSFFFLVFGVTRPPGEHGWVIVGFWTLVVAVIASASRWYRSRLPE